MTLNWALQELLIYGIHLICLPFIYTATIYKPIQICHSQQAPISENKAFRTCSEPKLIRPNRFSPFIWHQELLNYCFLHVTCPMPFSSSSCCNSLNFLWNSSKKFKWYFEHVYLIPAQLWCPILSFQKCNFWLSEIKCYGMSPSTW